MQEENLPENPPNMKSGILVLAYGASRREIIVRGQSYFPRLPKY
jgi:hypothetical protein